MENLELPTLYPDQKDLVKRTLEAVKRSNDVVVCGITGSGKSRLCKWMLGAMATRPRREGLTGDFLVAVHRRSLVDNLITSFSEEPRLPHGVIMSRRKTNAIEPIQVASIDTMLSWYCEGGGYQSSLTFDAIFYDECHANLPSYRKFLKGHNQVRKARGLRDPICIGLSATPETPGMGEVYKEIVYGLPAIEMQKLGRSCPYDYYHGVRCDQSKLKVKGGEFTVASIEEAVTHDLIGNMTRDWLRLCRGLPTISFFRTRGHARWGQEQYAQHGIKAEYIDCHTGDRRRRSLYESLGQEYDVLCNVRITERGTDIPCCAAIQLCLPVFSTKTYFQMIGRGSRRHAGKKFTRVLDHGGNVARHGIFEDFVDWKLLKDKEKPPVHKQRAVAECPQCGVLYRGGACSACGYEPTPRQLQQQELEFVDGEMQRIERNPIKRDYTDRLFRGVLFKAGRSGMTLGVAARRAIEQAEKEGQEFRWQDIKCVRLPKKGHADWSRQVSIVFPWTRTPSRSLTDKT